MPRNGSGVQWDWLPPLPRDSEDDFSVYVTPYVFDWAAHHMEQHANRKEEREVMEQNPVLDGFNLPPVKYGIELEGYINAHPDKLRDRMRELGLAVTRHSDTTAVFYDKIKITRDGSLAHSDWDRDISCCDCPYSDYDDDCTVANCIRYDDIYGIELVFPPAMGTESMMDIYTAFKAMDEFGWYVDNQAGMHVHIEAALENSYKLRNLVGMMALIEPLLIQTLPVDRRRNGYCLQMSRDVASLAALSRRVIGGLRQETIFDITKSAVYGAYDADTSYKYDRSRYYGLNLHSYFYRGTVEFRYFQGADNFEFAASAINLCACIVYYAMNNSYAFENVASNLKTRGSFNELMTRIINVPERAMQQFSEVHSPEIKGDYRRDYMKLYEGVV